MTDEEEPTGQFKPLVKTFSSPPSKIVSHAAALRVFLPNALANLIGARKRFRTPFELSSWAWLATCKYC